MSRMKRIRWLTNVMWSYRGWRKKVKSYLRIWRMKERPMTRSGQYYGNPLHKYHSWGRGGGGGTGQSFILVISFPRSNPSPFYIPFLTEKGTPFVHLPLTNGTPFMHLFWVYATGGQSWSQEDGKTLVLDKRDRAIASVFCRELHLTSLCSGLFQKICLKKGEVWRKFVSNIVILTFVTQGVPSAFLFRSTAHVHWGQSNEAKFKLGL